ncbi:MAG: hypothetical protein AAFP17_06545 [Pseudomonadota bacterium]
MHAHPLFADVAAPREARLDRWDLRWLTEADLDEDYRAVVESGARLQDFLGGDWPGSITREENRLDLAHHHVEFLARRSYAWVIREGGAYVGCAYLQPPWDPAAPMDAPFWFRTGAEAAEGDFAALWATWLSEPPWPAGMSIAVRWPGQRAG